MPINWKNRLTHWQPHREGGTVFSLAHLYPFAFTLDLAVAGGHAAQRVEIRVGFSNHTFTRKRTDQDGAAQHYADWTFCRERYPLSLSLPAIIRSLDGQNCFYAAQDNYFIVEAPNGREYWIFFDVRPTDEPDAVLLIFQSAYPPEAAPTPRGRRRKKVGFRVLVNLALQRKRPTPPA